MEEGFSAPSYQVHPRPVVRIQRVRTYSGFQLRATCAGSVPRAVASEAPTRSRLWEPRSLPLAVLTRRKSLIAKESYATENRCKTGVRLCAQRRYRIGQPRNLFDGQVFGAPFRIESTERQQAGNRGFIRQTQSIPARAQVVENSLPALRKENLRQFDQ